jgi:hypothetical protein
MDTKEPVRNKSGSAIIEKIENLVLWQRVAILVGFLVILFGAATWLLYLPKYDEITELDQKLQALEKKLATAKINAAELEKFQQMRGRSPVQDHARPARKGGNPPSDQRSKSGRDVGLEFVV